nr:E3 ubiquitin-protein ligase rnf8 isoform X3 [Nothobranchius furzeri]
MDSATADSCSAEDGECSDSEVLCLMRVGKKSDWLRLFEKAEITVGRGLDVTYQLLSSSSPLMISRLHCAFRQIEDGHWTVVDKKSLNGVWVNGNRISADEPYLLKLGDSIRLGVPLSGTKVEFDYILIRQLLRNIQPYLAKACRTWAKEPQVSKKSKRKLTVEEVEPSTSKPKLYRCDSEGKSFAKPCPLSAVKCQQRLSNTHLEETASSTQKQEQHSDGSSDPCEVDNLQRYSQNLLLLREQVDDTQKQVSSLGGEPRRADPLRREQEQKTQQQEELMKKQLEEALQEQKKVIDELADSRKTFEEILSAKNKELEETKEEKEKAKAQKEEVVTQVTEVLENELQCIICSELFIEAVILNCAHSFCCYCIKLWRKKKNECPICRQAIESQTRCLALDNCINRMVENLSLDMKARRQTLITERKGESTGERNAIRSAAAIAEVMVIHDDDSSSSSSDGSMVSIYSSFSSVDTDSSLHSESDDSSLEFSD